MNAEIVAITTDEMEDVKRMTRKLKLSFPVASDQDKRVTETFDLLDKPSGRAKTATVLVDGDGAVQWLRIGKSTSDHPSVQDIFHRLEKAS